MSVSKKRLYFSWFFLSLALVMNGQYIWPGDVNNNGIVNGIDVLYLGVAYGSTGPTRPGASTNWTQQDLGDLWSQDFPGDLNYAYADCDGNGEVNEEDLDEVIKDNLFETHGTLIPDEYSIGSPGESPQLQLVPQNNNVQTGEMVIFDLILGDDENPVDDFYGIAITLKYNDDFIFFGEWEFEDENNAWFDPSGDNSEYLDEADESSARIEVAITRTNQQTISGQGKLGELSIVIEDIVFGLQDSLNLEVEAIKLIDKDLNTLDVVGDSTFVIVSSPSQVHTYLNETAISVFPNPGNGKFTIKSTQPITGFELIDLSGRQASFGSSIQSGGFSATISIDKTKNPSGIYFLKGYTDQGIVIKKLVLE